MKEDVMRKDTSEINNGYDPLSDEECKVVAREMNDIPADERWGHLNTWGCDCFHAGQLDILVNGPCNTATNKTMTKAEALAWIEKIYG